MTYDANCRGLNEKDIAEQEATDFSESIIETMYKEGCSEREFIVESASPEYQKSVIDTMTENLQMAGFSVDQVSSKKIQVSRR